MAELGAAAPRYHEEIGARGGAASTSSSASASSPATTARTSGSRRRPTRPRVARAALRPGDAVLVKGSRAVGLEVVAAKLEVRPGVTRVLVAALVALIVSILAGPRFIAFLRRNEFGQHIREEGPPHHFAKQGTPTMGGLLILFAATIAFLPVERVPAASR